VGGEETKVTVKDKVWLLSKPLCEGLGLELVDIEYKKQGKTRHLRVLVDKVGGVSAEDLRALSLELSPLLDLEDFIPQRYILDVSSPGVERPLNRIEDFERFLGRRAAVSLFEPMGSVKKFEGRISKVLSSDGGLSVVFELSGGEQIDVPFSRIGRARLRWTTEELLSGIARNL